MEKERIRSRPLTSCSYRSTNFPTEHISISIPLSTRDTHNVSAITNCFPVNSSAAPKEISCSILNETPLPVPNLTVVTKDKLHKDLDALHEKISKLETRLKQSRPRPPLLPTTTTRPAAKAKFEGELNQLLDYSQRNNSLSICNTTRAIHKDPSRAAFQQCASTRSTSVRSLLSKTAQMALDQDKENLPENPVTDNVKENEEDAKRNEIVIQAKHEVLMQLTSSLEEERKKNMEYKKEVELWKKRSSVLEDKYNNLRQDYDELLNNYKASEQLRKQQKNLIQELQGTKSKSIKKRRMPK